MAPKRTKKPGKASGSANPARSPRASPVEARLTDAERLAKIDALEEKKKNTAAKAAATKAKNKKAKEEAAARALAAAQGEDEEPLPSVEDNDARPVRTPSAAGPSRRGRSDSVGDLRRRILATPSRGPRQHTPSEVIVASPSKTLRNKAKLNLCLRCSKRVYKDRRLLICEKKNPMSRCDYCVEQHNKCLPVSPQILCFLSVY